MELQELCMEVFHEFRMLSISLSIFYEFGRYKEAAQCKPAAVARHGSISRYPLSDHEVEELQPFDS